MAYLMEIEVAAPPPSAARRHAEIVVERAMLRELLAASAEIEDHATAPGKTVAEKKSTTRSSASWHWLTPHLPGSASRSLWRTC